MFKKSWIILYLAQKDVEMRATIRAMIVRQNHKLV